MEQQTAASYIRTTTRPIIFRCKFPRIISERQGQLHTQSSCSAQESVSASGNASLAWALEPNYPRANTARKYEPKICSSVLHCGFLNHAREPSQSLNLIFFNSNLEDKDARKTYVTHFMVARKSVEKAISPPSANLNSNSGRRRRSMKRVGEDDLSIFFVPASNAQSGFSPLSAGDEQTEPFIQLSQHVR